MRIERAKVGKRAFLGNSGMTGARAGGAQERPGRGAVGDARAGQGGHVVARQPAGAAAPRDLGGRRGRTFTPPRRLRVARGAVEVLPARAGGLHGRPRGRRAAGAPGVPGPVAGFWARCCSPGRWCSSPPSLAGLLTTAVEVGAGRPDRGRRPPAVELLRLAQRAGRHVRRDGRRPVVRPGRGRDTRRCACGCARSGRTIGRGVWCETYWLPEADLVALGDGASVNRGCVLQTHLFHDRIMSMDTVTLASGATLGPHGVILPAASIGERRHGRPGLAGAARRRRAGGDPLDRQPDRPVDGRRNGIGMTAPPGPPRSSAAGSDGEVDPYLPAHGNAGYDGQPLRARPGLPGRQQPARRHGPGCTPPRPSRSTGSASTWPASGSPR